MAAALLFDAAALTLFFEHPGNMGLSNRGTCLQLAQESISVPDNFEEFDERTWVQLLEPIQATQGSCCCWREEA